MWDITVEDVERIKKFFNVPDEIDEVLQPLIPEPIRATPTNDDYVAPATKSILDELLEEFGDEILNVTMVDEEADFNPTKDLEELERLLAKEPQPNFMKIQVHSVIINTEPFYYTQLMSPLYGVFKTSKPCKVDRDIISLGRRKAASEVYGVTSESLRRNHVEADESLAKHKALELEIERLLRAVVNQDIMSIVQNPSVLDLSNLQTELDPYNDMQQKIERLQAQLGDQKGKSKHTPCVSNTLDPLSQKLENENVELEFQVSEQKDTTKGTSVNTQFCKQSILGKPPSSSRSKLYAVTPFPKYKGLPKIDKTHALSKPVTSNSVPTPQESKVMNNDKVLPRC
ncbi:hypothetical protein Tco_0843874 [Tanacetum coccineum]